MWKKTQGIEEEKSLSKGNTSLQIVKPIKNEKQPVLYQYYEVSVSQNTYKIISHFPRKKCTLSENRYLKNIVNCHCTAWTFGKNLNENQFTTYQTGYHSMLFHDSV